MSTNKFTLLALCLIPAILSCGQEKEFKKNTDESIKNMLLAGGMASTITNNYSEVWSTAIQERTYRGQYIGDNFSLAISKAKYDVDSIGLYKTLDSIQKIVDSSIIKLKDHPSEFDHIYQETVSVYGSVSEYIELARNPQGSLLSFNNKRMDLESKISTKTKEIKIQIATND